MALDDNDIKQIRDVVLEALEVVVMPRFEEIDNRFDEVDRRFDEVDRRFEAQDCEMRDIKDEMRSGFASVNKRIDDLSGKVEALEADVKEIYKILADTSTQRANNNAFAKLSLEDKILQTHANLLIAAKQAGITLPN